MKYRIECLVQKHDVMNDMLLNFLIQQGSLKLEHKQILWVFQLVDILGSISGSNRSEDEITNHFQRIGMIARLDLIEQEIGKVNLTMIRPGYWFSRIKR